MFRQSLVRVAHGLAGPYMRDDQRDGKGTLQNGMASAPHARSDADCAIGRQFRPAVHSVSCCRRGRGNAHPAPRRSGSFGLGVADHGAANGAVGGAVEADRVQAGPAVHVENRRVGVLPEPVHQPVAARRDDRGCGPRLSCASPCGAGQSRAGGVFRTRGTTGGYFLFLPCGLHHHNDPAWRAFMAFVAEFDRDASGFDQPWFAGGVLAGLAAARSAETRA